MYVFFCSLEDGWSFKKKAEDESWEGCTVEFMTDP